MKQNRFFTFRVLLACLPLLLCGIQAHAWDSQPDANGRYDKFYDRPTFFPDWEQPSEWPNAMYYLCDVRLVDANGTRVPSYEIAVYDQNGELRHCGRSLPKDDNLSVLTIRGTEGDTFHFKVLYGDDFQHPTIVDIPNTAVEFQTNDEVGTPSQPFLLIIPGRTVFDENSTTLPVDKTGVNVSLKRTINANEWGTICLPFAIPASKMDDVFGQGWELCDFTGCGVSFEDDKTTVSSISVNFTKTSAIEANHPYIIKVSKDITSIEIDNVDIIALKDGEEAAVDRNELRLGTGTKKDPYHYVYNRFIGNYVNGFTVPDECLFLSGGKFWYSAGKTQMMGYRAYFDFYEVLPEAQNANTRITIVIEENEAVGISSVSHEPLATPRFYDLQGRCITHPSKGIYISGGHKYIIR